MSAVAAAAGELAAGEEREAGEGGGGGGGRGEQDLGRLTETAPTGAARELSRWSSSARAAGGRRRARRRRLRANRLQASGWEGGWEGGEEGEGGGTYELPQTDAAREWRRLNISPRTAEGRG